METLLFSRENIQSNTSTSVLNIEVRKWNAHQHVHIRECTWSSLSPVWNDLVSDAPDAAPGVVNVVTHSPRVSDFRCPVSYQHFLFRYVFIEDPHQSPTFSPIPHWQMKYWNERSTFSRLVAIFWKRAGDFASAESESTIFVFEVA